MPGPGGVPYVTQPQLSQYWPAAAFNGISVAQQAQACLDATGVADSRLSGRYQMPLLSWDSELQMYTAWVAIFLCFSTRGFSPQSGSDLEIRRRYVEAVGNPEIPGSIGWFDRVQRQALHPAIVATVPPNQSAVYNMPQVRSGIPRGWERGGIG